MDPEVKEQEKVEPEAEAKVCEFTGYVNKKDGKWKVKASSEECRKILSKTALEQGIDIEFEEPKEPCVPCEEAAKRFLKQMASKPMGYTSFDSG